MRVNVKWLDQLKTDLDAFDRDNPETHVERSISFNRASQVMILELIKRGIPHRVYNMGAGVKRITTDTDRCPCCRRSFNETPKKDGAH